MEAPRTIDSCLWGLDSSPNWKRTRTIMVCDGIITFRTEDDHSPCRIEQRCTTQQKFFCVVQVYHQVFPYNGTGSRELWSPWDASWNSLDEQVLFNAVPLQLQSRKDSSELYRIRSTRKHRRQILACLPESYYPDRQGNWTCWRCLRQPWKVHARAWLVVSTVTVQSRTQERASCACASTI